MYPNKGAPIPPGRRATEAGRTEPVTIKLSKRAARAAGTVAEVRDVGVSTLLNDSSVEDVVAEYDRIIALARGALGLG